MSVSSPQRLVHHVGITIPDLGEAVEFFRLLLETKELGTEHHNHAVFLEQITGYDDLELRVAFFAVPGNDVVLELLQYVRPEGVQLSPETNNPGNMHLCIGVPDIEAEYRRLSDAGVRFRSPGPVTVPDGPYAGAKFAYLRGPGGITIELGQSPG